MIDINVQHDYDSEQDEELDDKEGEKIRWAEDELGRAEGIEEAEQPINREGAPEQLLRSVI